MAICRAFFIGASMFRTCVAVFICLLSAAAFAQEEETVVPAHEEPRHVPKLVNEWVRIIDVEIPEGEQTRYHRHSIDYPYVFVTSVMLENQVFGQAPKDQQMQAGLIGYYDIARQGEYTHRFINRGPGTFRAIGIELLKPRPSTPPPELPPIPGADKALETERVAAYRIRLPAGTSIGPVRLAGPSIRVALGNGRVRDRIEGSSDSTTDLRPALFHFRDAPVTLTIENVGNVEVELVEFVLK
jgi:hypothetical protein